jgi:release factor glutamine methyltransferase
VLVRQLDSVSIQDVLRTAADELARAGVENARLDAELILGKALGLSRLELYLDHDRPLIESERDVVRALVERRSRREPLAYVLGEWGFRGLTLRCDARALVPRPETEVVVERCLALLEGLEDPAVLDVGTGTGAIALAVADEHPGARVTALEASPAAIDLARENADLLGLAIELVEGDLHDGLPGGPYDLVVSNPPYVRADELPGLSAEVRDWEPRGALLDEGQTAAVVRAARGVLKTGGWLVLEMHWDGAADVLRQLQENGYGSAVVSRDLAGRERVVEARWES